MVRENLSTVADNLGKSWDGFFTWDQTSGLFPLETECLMNSKTLDNVLHQDYSHSGLASQGGLANSLTALLYHASSIPLSLWALDQSSA